MEYKGVIKAVAVIANIVEVFCWIGVAFSAAITAVTILGKQYLYHYLMTADQFASSIDIMGFEISTVDASALAPGAFVVAFITALFAFVLMALIARNIRLIFKTATGKTKFSIGKTPFQPSIVRMLRQIGIFAIAMPVVGLIMQPIAGLALGFTTISTSIDFTGVFFGLGALALTQFFAYGMSLQSEVDGLL